MTANYVLTNGRKINYDDMPVFPVYRIAHAPTEEDWGKACPMDSFRNRGTDNLAQAAKFVVKFILSGNQLIIRATCLHGSSSPLPMCKDYDGWRFDNALELFFGLGDETHHFELNADGAKLHYLLGARKKVPMPTHTFVGRNEQGCWELTLSLPAEQFMPEGRVALKVMGDDIVSILGAQYYDSLNCPATFHFGLLKECPAGTSPAKEYLSQYAIPADMDFVRKMACSIYQKCNTPIPDGDMSDIGILGMAHDAFTLVKYQRNDMAEVDFNCENGPMKLLHGINFGPHIAHQSQRDMNDSYKALGVVSARMHDVPLSNPGCRLVDTHLIFPLECLDPSQPENYYFDHTDYYLKNTLDQGTQIYYRLGVSIDHGKEKFNAKAPKDYYHFAEVCAGIVRHYNHGWANGYHWNIPYWEIWNEAEYPSMWDKSYDEFVKLFVIVLKRLKAEFPEIKVGGPSSVGLNMPTFRKIGDACKAEQISPDFFSWHIYSSNLEGMAFQPFAARALIDAIGFPKAEIHLTEWHYINMSPGTPDGEADMGGMDSAAFTACVLSAWQDSPMDLEHYYDAGFGSYGIYDRFYHPKRVYYALCAYGKFQREYTTKVQYTQGPAGTICLGGKNAAGDGLVLLSCMKVTSPTVKLRLKGLAGNARIIVKALDDTHDLEPVDFSQDGDVIVLDKPQDSTVFLIECQRHS